MELLLAESLRVALRSNLNALRQPQPRRGHHYVSCNQQNLSQPNAKQWVKLRRMPPAWNSGDAYELAELGEVATVDRLLQDLGSRGMTGGLDLERRDHSALSRSDRRVLTS
jgi:hypothetical protein